VDAVIVVRLAVESGALPAKQLAAFVKAKRVVANIIRVQ
jgi:hypothetical protein